MLQNEFEKESKGKLEARLIQPSTGSWDRLSERLDNQKSKQQYKQKYWWLGVAASLVGVLFIAQHFFYNDSISKSIDTNKIELVNNDEDKKTEKELLNIPTAKVLGKQKVSNKANKKTIPKAKLVNTENKEKKKHHNKSMPSNVASKEKVVLSEITDLSQKDDVSKKETLEKQKIKEILDKVYVLKESKVEVSDAVIDDLLLKAQMEIDIEKSNTTNQETVNASLLLKSAEKDLDVSFRNKVLVALKENYSKVKTAIVQRKE